MALKAIVQKLKVIKIREVARRFIEGKKGPRKKKRASGKVISHGHHLVEKGGSVIIQRDQVGLWEVWLFGAFDQQIADGFIKFLQSHLFEKKLQPHLSEEQLSEKQVVREAKETMKNAYNATTTKNMQPDEMGGCASALIIVNGEKIVAAYFGGYKAVLCNATGRAIQIGNRRQISDIRLLLRSTLNGISVYAERLLGGSAVDEDEIKNNSSLVVGAETVGSKTEFLIVASNGVWDVLRNQEAVHLIRHIEDPQEAAKCLADEALARNTKSAVICIVIRFK